MIMTVSDKCEELVSRVSKRFCHRQVRVTWHRRLGSMLTDGIATDSLQSQMEEDTPWDEAHQDVPVARGCRGPHHVVGVGPRPRYR